jgi:hypothetical protein
MIDDQLVALPSSWDQILLVGVLESMPWCQDRAWKLSISLLPMLLQR